MSTQKENWHLSRSFNITQIMAIVAQTIALIWFVATLRNDVDLNKSQLIRQETRLTVLEQTVQSQAVMLARIDENLKAIRELVERNADRPSR